MYYLEKFLENTTAQAIVLAFVGYLATAWSAHMLARRKDKLALDAVASLDEETLLRQVATQGISMCGVLPTYIVLVAAKALGAKHAEVVDYRTSGDTTGDYSAVVGYGAVVIE